MANVNFFLLKINGIDIGQLPIHQQMTALSTLYNEDTENIVLELKRKSCWTTYKNVEEYDAIEIAKNLCFLTIHHNTPMLENTAENNSKMATIGSNVIVNLHLPAYSLEQYCMTKGTQTDDITFYVHEHLHNLQEDTERVVEHEHNLFEQSLAPEIDIEEITLRKSDSNERLGITVCYSNADDYTDGGGGSTCEVFGETFVTEVYISDIHPDSVAGRDGRLRQGDQILQINGKYIKTRPETETLIAENNNAVTLLVSRYLYANEDDFNDPSTNEDDDEFFVVEDDDDDEDDDEFYEESNIPYVNCHINSDCINATGELDKVLVSEVDSQEHVQQSEGKLKEKYNIDSCNTLIRSNPTYQTNSLNNLSDQKETISRSEKKNFATKYLKNKKLNTSKIDTCSSVKSHIEYDTEHIYETIPEDSESEPFYCSPYDSSVYVTAMNTCSSTISDALEQLQQKQRVAQWLGIKPPQEICSTIAPRQLSRINHEHTFAFLNKNSTDTVLTALTSLTDGSVDGLVTNFSLPSNCQLEDQDNSSSAYNTGGSNNSVSPLTLMLNPKNRAEQNHTLPTTTISSPINSIADNFGIQQLTKASVQIKTHSLKDKSKITSPKSGTYQQKVISCAHKSSVKDVQSQSIIVEKSATTSKDNRNVLQKRNCFNPTLSLEKSLHSQPLQQKVQYYFRQQPDLTQCPQFTAPNLSQYHFVSSQESSTVATAITNNTRKDEDTMVWKVKRRPDGTRYIVRRPAKNRLVKERNTRLTVERLRNDITTTEDDTISEIKTGRYWTREERKKHIEKARERRQQQLCQQQLNKTHLAYDDPNNATPCIGDVANRMLQNTSERGKVKNQHISNVKNQQQIKPAPQQQHYQLQFSSNDVHNHSSLPYSIESPTKKSSSTLLTTFEEFNSTKANVDQLSTIVFTIPEHNQINNSLKSVTMA